MASAFGDEPTAERYDEEMVVTAAPLAPGEVPSSRYIADTYNAVDEGTRLYQEERYKEALPHLEVAAKRGFKWAAARAGDIYLHGRGGAPKSISVGLAWLGVAAEPRTATRSAATSGALGHGCLKNRPCGSANWSRPTKRSSGTAATSIAT